MVKRFVIAFILVALVAGGLIGFNIFRDQAIEQFFANMVRPPVTVSTTTVEPVTWQPTIDAIGTANASRGVDLTVEASGTVREILFSSNARVEQGEILVHLDDEVQRADLAAAEAQAAANQQTLARTKELRSRGVGSQSDLEAAQAAASASASQVAKLQAVLDQRQLKAPFSGTIGLPRIDLGQYVSPGVTVATLQNLDTMRANFTVPEQQFGALKIGQPVQAGLTEENMPFSGRIIGIDPKIDPATRLVSVRAEITNPDGKLNPGQFVRIRVELPAEENVIAVPQTALVTSLYGDYVYVVRPAEQSGNGGAAEQAGNGDTAEQAGSGGAASAAPAQNAASNEAAKELTVEQVFVKLGRRSDGQVEIVEGLSAGDIVVNAGQNRLSNRARIVIDNSLQPIQVGEATE